MTRPILQYCMICRLTGVLENVDGNRAVLALIAPGERGAGAASAIAREVLVPTYLSERLRSAAGSNGTGLTTFHTLEYLEGQGQGTSFIPRIIGFASEAERDLFELLTTVKGLGNKRALRAMAVEPGRIAQAIGAHDAKFLQTLPEIGRKLAETIILELKDKVQPLLADLGAEASTRPAGVEPSAGGFAELKGDAALAINAIVGLGETEGTAERMVRRALHANPELSALDEIIQAAYQVRV